ncbi:MAG TPA: MBL fold metallo-hydrolase [Candidatus Binatia bacterium]|nr:MBL fold metallo-hydrolase [Candidatus Binatia bacterium]
MKMKQGAKRALARRSFVAGASLAGAAWATEGWGWPTSAGTPSQAAHPAGPLLLDGGFASARKIAEGVYAVVSDTTKGFDTLCNGGFFLGRDAAIVWEGYATAKGAAFQLQALQKVYKRPVMAAIDSHYHFDHTCGNSQYAEAKIPIWAHAKVGPLIQERYVPLQKSDKSQFLEAAEKHLHDAVSEDDQKHAEGDLAALKNVAALVDAAVLTLPTRSLQPSELPMKIDLGGLELVLETHPGHTPGDLILRVPAQEIVFAGDLLFNHSYPVTMDADVASWMQTLDAFGRFGRKTLFVPGHGPVCGQEGVELLKTVFADLAQHARQMAQLGVPLPEAQRRYSVPERFKGLGMMCWEFCVDQAVAQFYEAAVAGKI